MVDQARPEGARTAEMAELLAVANTGGFCAFCELSPKNIIIFQSDAWTAIHCLSPRWGSKHHLILIARRHVESYSYLTVEEWQDLHASLMRLEGELGYDDGALVMRFGYKRRNSATVHHLCVQVLRSNGEAISNQNIYNFLVREFTELIRKEGLDLDPAVCAELAWDRIRSSFEALMLEAPKGIPPLEYITIINQALDALRSQAKRKAFPIREIVSGNVVPG
jgi:diadenosine tetraphosphate (Ap4A) HIT family hydrolase